jgi:hypothetical protein
MIASHQRTGSRFEKEVNGVDMVIRRDKVKCLGPKKQPPIGVWVVRARSSARE